MAESLSEVGEKLDRVIALLEGMTSLLSLAHQETYTEAEAAKILKLSPKYLAGIRADGLISFIPIGGGDQRYGRVRYTKDDLMDYLKNNRRKIAG